MTTRWRWPPDSSCGKRNAKSVAGRSPAASSAATTRPRARRAVADPVDVERLGDEVVDRLLRIERLVRVLEDDLDAPPVGAQGAVPQSVADVPALERRSAGGLAGQLDDDPAGRGLAAARFADQRQDLAR